MSKATEAVKARACHASHQLHVCGWGALGALMRPIAPQVVVRCRPLNSKEKGDGRQVIVDMNVRQGQVRVRRGRQESSRAAAL